MKRDGGKHASPNSGMPEAAMAGALGVRLGGPAIYDGKKVHKSYIGDEKEDSIPHYIRASERALMLTKVSSFMGLLFVLIII